MSDELSLLPPGKLRALRAAQAAAPAVVPAADLVDVTLDGKDYKVQKDVIPLIERGLQPHLLEIALKGASVDDIQQAHLKHLEATRLPPTLSPAQAQQAADDLRARVAAKEGQPALTLSPPPMPLKVTPPPTAPAPIPELVIPPPVETPAIAQEPLPTPPVCPCCNWDPKIDPLAITEDEKRQWLIGALTNQAYIRKFEILGGRASVTFRTLTQAETDAIHQQLMAELAIGKLSTLGSEVGVRAARLRLASQLLVLEVDGKQVKYVNPFSSDAEAMYQAYRTAEGEAMLSVVDRTVISQWHPGLYTAIQHVNNRFLGICNRLMDATLNPVFTRPLA